MNKITNTGECIECGRYFYESAYQDVCPECIKEQEYRSGEASPDEYEEIEPLPQAWVM